MARLLTVSQTPSINAGGTYSANDAIGGTLTFSGFGNQYNNAGRINQVVIVDNAQQNSQLELHLFNQSFTAMADGSAWAPGTADARNYAHVISFGSSDYYNGASNSVGIVDVDIPVVLAPGGTVLYGQLVCRDTPNYSNADDLTVIVQVEEF
jgi:hypothetical protein